MSVALNYITKQLVGMVWNTTNATKLVNITHDFISVRPGIFIKANKATKFVIKMTLNTKN